MGKKKAHRRGVKPIRSDDSVELVVDTSHPHDDASGPPASEYVGVVQLVEALRRSESARADLTRRVLDTEGRELAVLRSHEDAQLSQERVARIESSLESLGMNEIRETLEQISAGLVQLSSITDAKSSSNVDEIDRLRREVEASLAERDDLRHALSVTQAALEEHQAELASAYGSFRWRALKWWDRLRARPARANEVTP
jgi:hypothetical protein